jgi:hypothetical protein
MKQSPALSVTRISLRVLIVLNWILGGLILTLLAATFQAEEWTWRALGVGAVAGHGAIVAGMRAIMVIGIAAVPIAYVVLRELSRIVGPCVTAIRSAPAMLPACARLPGRCSASSCCTCSWLRSPRRCRRGKCRCASMEASPSPAGSRHAAVRARAGLPRRHPTARRPRRDGLMPILVKLDEVLYERRMTLTELAARIDITLANLSILKTGKARAIRFLDPRRDLPGARLPAR